jgi:hypothetical protein
MFNKKDNKKVDFWSSDKKENIVQRPLIGKEYIGRVDGSTDTKTYKMDKYDQKDRNINKECPCPCTIL